MESATPAYKRIVLKLSGEALREAGGRDNISPQIVKRNRATGQGGLRPRRADLDRGRRRQYLARTVGESSRDGSHNRGLHGHARHRHQWARPAKRARAKRRPDTRVQTAIEMQNVAEPFILRRAVRHLEQGRVVIFVAGTGNPYFSTDTTAALRASEIGADIILKATKVDGIYDRDPKMHPDAQRYEQISYNEALTKRLQVMDSTAFSLCMDNKIPILVFDMLQPTNVRDAVLGKRIGTLVTD